MLILYTLLVALLLALRIWAGPILHPALGPPGDVIVGASFGFLLAVFAAILIDRLIRRLYWRAYFVARQKHEAPALLRDLATVLIFVLALSLWLYIDLDFSAAGIFAASGATAVVIGLALQAMILDLFSGLSINLDRSYVIGDWLTVHSQELPEPVYGKVEGISWRCTLLRLVDGTCISLPNRLVTANPVTNHSQPAGPKRLSVDFAIDIRVPAERVIRLLRGEAFKAAQVTGMRLDPPPSVLLNRIEGDASIYRVRFYADPETMEPEDACAAMRAVLHGVIARAGLPNPVQQVELSPQAPSFDQDTPLRDALAAVPLFGKALNSEQLDLLAAGCKPATFEPEAALMVQGALESSMFVILEGAARVFVTAEGSSAPRQIAVLASGDIVGEMSLMTGAPRSATAIALTPLRALTITKETLEALFESAPELLERFSRILAEREAELRARASETVRWDFVQRDLIARMRTFFARAFSGEKRPG